MLGTEAAINRGTDGYHVGNAIVIDDGDASRLSRTFVAGQRQYMTFSCWVKRGNLVNSVLFSTNNGTNRDARIEVNNNQIRVYSRATDGGESAHDERTVNTFTDPSASMHVHVVLDSTLAVAADRCKIWVDGIQQATTNASTIVQNVSWGFGQAAPHYILSNNESITTFDGYMAEPVYLGGGITKLPTDFGEWTPDAPDVWRPRNLGNGRIDFSAYDNACYLNFADPDDMGKDVSGQANSFARTNITSANQVTDTPTNNCGTMSPVINLNNVTLSNGNRRCIRTATTNNAYGGFAMATGNKWYYECLVEGIGIRVGLQGLSLTNSDEYSLQTSTGNIVNSGSGNNYSSIVPIGTLLGVAVDLVNDTVEFYYDGVGQGTFPINQTDYYARFRGDGNNGIGAYRFNEDEFSHAPPAGFNALMDKYLP